MSRRAWLGVGAVLLAGGVGAGVWAWFLAGQTLDVADKWSSVLAGLAAVLLGPAGLVVALLALRKSAAEGGGVLVGERGVNTGGAVNAPIITGDGSSAG